jgi:hypothetical protein
MLLMLACGGASGLGSAGFIEVLGLLMVMAMFLAVPVGLLILGTIAITRAWKAALSTRS